PVPLPAHSPYPKHTRSRNRTCPSRFWRPARRTLEHVRAWKRSALARTRISDLGLRKPALYPTELRTHPAPAARPHPRPTSPAHRVQRALPSRSTEIAATNHETLARWELNP